LFIFAVLDLKGVSSLRKLLFIYALLIAAFLLYIYDYHTRNEASSLDNQNERLRGEVDETYVMVTFLVGIDYWKNVLKGFEDAAEALNVSVEYRGATQYDVNEQITVLEQVIAGKPAGIALTAIHPDALNVSIEKAIEAGIPVVIFDSDAPKSKAFSFLGTNNYKAGATAAHHIANLVDSKGKVAIVTLPNQFNHVERARGFEETMENEYPEIEIIAKRDGKGDQLVSGQIAKDIIQQHPDLKGVFVTEANGGVGVGEAIRDSNKTSQVKIVSFDISKATLDRIKDGTISATLAQGTWNMGYWSLQNLFHHKHELIQTTRSQLQDRMHVKTNLDTGITIVTKENVDDFYAK
jgi:ribose transport system substrate-binding protein